MEASTITDKTADDAATLFFKNSLFIEKAMAESSNQTGLTRKAFMQSVLSALHSDVTNKEIYLSTSAQSDIAEALKAMLTCRVIMQAHIFNNSQSKEIENGEGSGESPSESSPGSNSSEG